MKVQCSNRCIYKPLHSHFKYIHFDSIMSHHRFVEAAQHSPERLMWICANLTFFFHWSCLGIHRMNSFVGVVSRASPSSRNQECRGRSPLPGIGAAHLGDAIAVPKISFIYSPPQAASQKPCSEETYFTSIKM